MGIDGQSHLDRAALIRRANCLDAVRAFFKARDVIEVITPALSKAAVTDPALISFKLEDTPFYLHTSPEFAMKRLLASGSGDIYQIATVFRDEELGRWHQPEFLCLEWYRVGLDHMDLAQEVVALIQTLMPIEQVVYQRYSDVFEQTFALDALDQTPLSQLQDLATRHLQAQAMHWQRQDCLDALLDGIIMPTWQNTPCVVLYDYPADQAALAKIDIHQQPSVAMRFEVFVQGIECANGFYELNDAAEQRARFEQENSQRSVPVPMDEAFLACLDRMPNCAGVALGLDRVFALAEKQPSLAKILPFAHQVS